MDCAVCTKRSTVEFAAAFDDYLCNDCTADVAHPRSRRDAAHSRKNPGWLDCNRSHETDQRATLFLFRWIWEYDPSRRAGHSFAAFRAAARTYRRSFTRNACSFCSVVRNWVFREFFPEFRYELYRFLDARNVCRATDRTLGFGSLEWTNHSADVRAGNLRAHPFCAAVCGDLFNAAAHLRRRHSAESMAQRPACASALARCFWHNLSGRVASSLTPRCRAGRINARNIRTILAHQLADIPRISGEFHHVVRLHDRLPRNRNRRTLRHHASVPDDEHVGFSSNAFSLRPLDDGARNPYR